MIPTDCIKLFRKLFEHMNKINRELQIHKAILFEKYVSRDIPNEVLGHPISSCRFSSGYIC